MCVCPCTLSLVHIVANHVVNTCRLMVYKEATQEQSGQDVEEEATRGALIKHHLDISLRILVSMEMVRAAPSFLLSVALN